MDEIQRAKRPESYGYIPFEDDEPYRGVTLSKATQFISSNGCSGEPQLATSEKGRHLFEHAVQSLLTFLDSFKTWRLLENLNK